MRKQLLKIDQVAEVMAVSTKTVYRLINQGALTAIKIGRSTRIAEHEVEMFVEQKMNGGLKV